MKKYISTIAQISIYLGLPISFAAAAFHQIASPIAATASHPLFNQADLLAPVIFISSVIIATAMLIHSLREEQRTAQFIGLHLRHTPANREISRSLRNTRLATANAV